MWTRPVGLWFRPAFLVRGTGQPGGSFPWPRLSSSSREVKGKSALDCPSRALEMAFIGEEGEPVWTWCKRCAAAVGLAHPLHHAGSQDSAGEFDRARCGPFLGCVDALGANSVGQEGLE
jgi:hypothetical protein